MPSPKFKNLSTRPKQSPIEIKEKMRKDYKNKVQCCRGLLMDKLRGSCAETVMRDTLTNIYKGLFNSPEENIHEEDYEIIDKLQNELVQEELEWWIKEYEQCQMLNVDWSSIEESNDVICPICQKTNLQLNNGVVSCSLCNMAITTERSLPDIKKYILGLIDNHNSLCNSDVQFGLVAELNESHVYLVCETCMEMKLVI